MEQYIKYIILIVIGICIANVWLYIKQLEFEKKILLEAFETNLFLQNKQETVEKTDDSN